MVDLEPKSKFTFIAEVLPQNERTREIMAAREAKENQKRAEEEEVKSPYQICLLSLSYSGFIESNVITSFRVVETLEGEGRERQKEEAEGQADGAGEEGENGERHGPEAQGGGKADEQVGGQNAHHA
jgi:hypothetical protein